MPVIPQFDPGQGTDFIGQQMSLMQRAQAMREQQDKAREDDVKFQAFKPAIIAEGQAKLAGAQAAVANAARMEQLRTKAATESIGYNDRYLNILSIPDPKDKADSLAALQGEVAWMDTIPEYKGFVDAVNNARASAYTMALTNMKLDQHLNETQAQIDARTNQHLIDAGARTDVANIAAGAKTSNALTYSTSREKIAQINADTKLSVEDKKAQKSAVQLEELQNRATEADQAAADAQASGDPHAAQAHREAAASYRDAIKKTTTFATQEATAPRDKSQDPTPTPKVTESGPKIQFSLDQKPATESANPVVAPTKVSKKDTSVKIGGKDYPIFVDKNGNRAYKIDGHYVPIQAE